MDVQRTKGGSGRTSFGNLGKVQMDQSDEIKGGRGTAKDCVQLRAGPKLEMRASEKDIQRKQIMVGSLLTASHPRMILV